MTADREYRMIDIRIIGTEKIQQYEELAKVFLQPGEYRIRGGSGMDPGEQERAGEVLSVDAIHLSCRFEGDWIPVSRRLYEDLARITGKHPRWGILTGIRPVKLAGELAEEKLCGKSAEDSSPADRAALSRLLQDRYLLHGSKAELVTEILEYQRDKAGEPETGSMALYVGIPFCPTRCLYCSFPSNQVDREEYGRYLEALHEEIAFAGEKTEEAGASIESVYIGGGTPTELSAAQLDGLLGEIRGRFDLSACREFTVEGGRPDTFTEEKLEILRKWGVDRLSINPQTMKQETLDLIGRRHTVEETEEAFRMAGEAGFPVINTDLIAGLPGEEPEDFARSLERVLDLGAHNITLHTLAVKRGSKLKERDENFNYRDEEIREEMLGRAEKTLREKGFRPYYLYRQKHTSGNTENLGYCRKDAVSLYNIRIMEEHQSILALGAGGISKIYFPAENRLERVPNVSNYEIYIERIQEMLRRKAQGFFGPMMKKW